MKRVDGDHGATCDRGPLCLAPEREPITRPVFVWLEVAVQLAFYGDGDLATAIQQAMDWCRIRDNATSALTVDGQVRVNAVL